MSSIEKNKACAYLLISTEPGQDVVDGVVSELKKRPYIKEAHGVFGVYDAIARVEVEANSPTLALEQLISIVEKEIKIIPGIRRNIGMKIADNESGLIGFKKDEEGNYENFGSKKF